MLLGFALVLLSMFFFYVARRGRTLVARRTLAALSSRSFYVSPTARTSRDSTAPDGMHRYSHALGPIHPV